MNWYFDFISPYAYLQSTRLEELGQLEDVTCVPILFAGLLNHWDNVGPAEVLPKRDWTFKNVLWLSNRNNIPINFPPHHPFNPLPLLRLSIVHQNSIDVVKRLFEYVWVEGKLPQDETAFKQLLKELNTTPEQLEASTIKDQLRENGIQAIERDVFGVPSIDTGDDIIWGYEATEMAIAAIKKDAAYQACRFEQADKLPHGPARKRP